MAYWKCTNCGLELSHKEVCESGGHNCEDKSEESILEKAAKKVARTGNRSDLQEYLKLRRNFI